jgi:hypothetical protein
MKRFLLPLSAFAMCFSASAQKTYLDLTQYDAVNSSNVAVVSNDNGSVTLSLSDPEQPGYVLFNGITDFSGYEKLFFNFQTPEAPNGAFTYTLAGSDGLALYDNSTNKGTYRPYGSLSATGDLDVTRIKAEGGDVSSCYFAVIIAATSLTATLSNAYAYIPPALPPNATDLQTIDYMSFSVTDNVYAITQAPRTISVPSFSGWSSGNKDIIGDFVNWNVIPGKYWDLTAYDSLKLQLTAPAEMAGKTFRIRVGSIPAVVPEDPANYGGTYTAKSKYVEVTLTGGTQTISVDLTPADDITKYVTIIRFMDPVADGNISLDIDYIVALVGATVVSVSVTPSATTVAKGYTRQFSAEVEVTGGAAQTVAWSVAGNSHESTTISDDGLLTVAADETATALTVTATSTADPTKYDTAEVTVADQPLPEVVSVAVTPSTATVAKGETYKFSASVEVKGGAAQTVTWSVPDRRSEGTSVSDSGLLTVAAGETAKTLTVTATSTVDNTKRGTATVTVSGGAETAAESLLTAAITLYPNPFADELHISGAEGCTLRLINASGATVLLRQLASPSETLSLETLPAGLYFLHFEKDGKSKTIKGYKGN